MTQSDIQNLAFSHLGGKGSISTYTTAAGQWFATARDEILRSHSWGFATKRTRLTQTYVALSGAAITNSGGLIKVTKVAHGLTTGNRIYLKDAEGVTAANGQWYITRIDADNFTLDYSVFSGTYTNGTGEYVLTPQFDWDFQHDLPADCLRVLKVNGDSGGFKDESDDHLIEQGYLLCDSETLNLTYIFQNTDTTSWPSDFINCFSYLLASYMAQQLVGVSGKAMELRQAYQNALLPITRSRDAREGKPRRTLPFEDSQLLAARGGYIQTAG